MRIAVAGLGNVGAATLKVLQANADLLAVRAGQALEVVAVSARDGTRKRGCDVSGIVWENDPRMLAARGDVDVVVEAIGGAGGIAYDLAVATLKAGKHFVTANKALIAAKGVELALLAEAAGAQLSFEAAVCGAVPVLKMLREGLAANRISSIRGILNGTCNYILMRMESEGMDFSAALAEAQKQGFAEADPSDDIDGIDTANKLAILAAVAFGRKPDLEAIFIEGIRSITQNDLRDAAARGGRIKLLGTAICDEKSCRHPRLERGSSIARLRDKDSYAASAQGGNDDCAGGEGGRVIDLKVEPVFVPLSDPLSRIDGVTNAVQISGDFSGETLIQGRGAGDPTASAIVADLIDIARGHRSFAFGVAAERLA